MCSARNYRGKTPQGPDAAIRSLELPPSRSVLSEGRGFVARAAQEAGFPEDRVFDIALSCSEAIANAIEHGPGGAPVGVKVITFADRLEVRVASEGEFQAPSRTKGPTHRGLGLPLMVKLTDQLTLSSGPGGGTLVSLCFHFAGPAAG
jgi:anti-sigma regulatory factor (Ser/Thr protein kinase)